MGVLAHSSSAVCARALAAASRHQQVHQGGRLTLGRRASLLPFRNGASILGFSTSTASSQSQASTSQRPWWFDLEGLPLVHKFMTLVRSCAEVGDIQLAERRFQEFSSLGVPLQAEHFNALMHVYTRVGDVVGAEKVVGRMRKAGAQPDVYTYCDLIRVCGDNISQAENYLQAMLGARVQPTLPVCNAFLAVCADAGDAEGADAFLRHMQEVYHVEPNTTSINSIITACANAGQPDEAVKWFHAAHEVDSLSYSSVINAFAKVGQLEEAENWLDKMGSAELLSEAAIHALIVGYGRQGDVKNALRHFNAMKKHGLTPTTQSFNVLIQACVAAGDIDAAQAKYEKMRRRGVPRDVITFTTLIKAFGGAGRGQEADAVYAEMQEAAVPPNIFTFVTRMRAFASSKDVARAEQLLSEMQGLSPNAEIYNGLVNVYASNRDWKGAEQVMGRLMKNKVKPDALTFCGLLKACARGGDAKRSELWAARMESAGLVLDGLSYHSRINAFSQVGDLSECIRLAEEMQNRGFALDVAVFAMIIRACAPAGNIVQAQALLSRMKDKGVKPNEFTTSALLQTCVAAGDVHLAERSFVRMLREGVKPTDTCFSDILRGLAAPHADLARIEGWFARMRAAEIQPERVAFDLQLKACAFVDDVGKAQSVFYGMVKRSRALSPGAFRFYLRLLSQEGNLQEVNKVFSIMQERQHEPDKPALRSRLLACKRAQEKDSAKYQRQAMETAEETVRTWPHMVVGDEFCRAYLNQVLGAKRFNELMRHHEVRLGSRVPGTTANRKPRISQQQPSRKAPQRVVQHLDAADSTAGVNSGAPAPATAPSQPPRRSGVRAVLADMDALAMVHEKPMVRTAVLSQTKALGPQRSLGAWPLQQRKQVDQDEKDSSSGVVVRLSHDRLPMPDFPLPVQQPDAPSGRTVSLTLVEAN